MDAYICTACGMQYAPSEKPPAQCTICEEERQYVPPAGNVLWDCVSLIDDATVTIVEALGGISAIAISHPHFYTTMVV